MLDERELNNGHRASRLSEYEGFRKPGKKELRDEWGRGFQGICKSD